MPGLVPGIHVLRHRGVGRERTSRRRDVDGRDKPGHDEKRKRYDPLPSCPPPYMVMPARLPSCPYVDASVDASIFLEGFGACGQVLSCVRPLRCGVLAAAGQYGYTRIGSKSDFRARAHAGHGWFSRSRLIDHLPLRRPPSCPHPRRSRACPRPLRRRREPGSPHCSSSAPRRCAPSGWPARRRPASWACAPASGRATGPSSRRAGTPSAPPPWRL